jgi:hypothetical protein
MGGVVYHTADILTSSKPHASLGDDTRRRGRGAGEGEIEHQI